MPTAPAKRKGAVCLRGEGGQDGRTSPPSSRTHGRTASRHSPIASAHARPARREPDECLDAVAVSLKAFGESAPGGLDNADGWARSCAPRGTHRPVSSKSTNHERCPCVANDPQLHGHLRQHPGASSEDAPPSSGEAAAPPSRSPPACRSYAPVITKMLGHPPHECVHLLEGAPASAPRAPTPRTSWPASWCSATRVAHVRAAGGPLRDAARARAADRDSARLPLSASSLVDSGSSTMSPSSVSLLASSVTGTRTGLKPRATKSRTRLPGVRRPKPKWPPGIGYQASGEPSGMRRNAS